MLENNDGLRSIFMQIISRVIVKQVLTEKSKASLADKFQKEKEQLKIECEQLKFEEKKLLHKYGTLDYNIQQRMKEELSNREERMANIDFKMEQLSVLELGSEIVERELQALEDISIGDSWDEVISPKIVVIEDDIIVRIDG